MACLFGYLDFQWSGVGWNITECHWKVYCLQIADFGLAHAGRRGNAKFELVTTEVRGTPGEFVFYMARRLVNIKRANKCTCPFSVCVGSVWSSVVPLPEIVLQWSLRWKKIRSAGCYWLCKKVLWIILQLVPHVTRLHGPWVWANTGIDGEEWCIQLWCALVGAHHCPTRHQWWHPPCGLGSEIHGQWIKDCLDCRLRLGKCIQFAWTEVAHLHYQALYTGTLHHTKLIIISYVIDSLEETIWHSEDLPLIVELSTHSHIPTSLKILFD